MNHSAWIGYPSGQDGAISPARDCPLYPAITVFFFLPCNQFLIEKPCPVKMAGYWPRFLYGPRRSRGP